MSLGPGSPCRLCILEKLKDQKQASLTHFKVIHLQLSILGGSAIADRCNPNSTIRGRGPRRVGHFCKLLEGEARQTPAGLEEFNDLAPS